MTSGLATETEVIIGAHIGAQKLPLAPPLTTLIHSLGKTLTILVSTPAMNSHLFLILPQISTVIVVLAPGQTPSN